MSKGLPTGDVTFVFTDIEGSTKLFHELGDAYLELLNDHNRIVRTAMSAGGGVEVKTEGDAFFVAFAAPEDAVRACIEAQLALRRHPWAHGREVKVRIGVHAGSASIVDDDYVGIAVHEAARLAAAAHGGQILVSATARDRVADNASGSGGWLDLGPHALKDFPRPQRIFQVLHPELGSVFPPPRTLSARSYSLPAQASAFVGRGTELEIIQRWMIGDARLVTVTGPGGMGKSRLAIEAGWSLLSWFREGVWFIPLSQVTDPERLIPSIKEALGIPDAPGRSDLEWLIDRVGVGPTVLILDNLEQVLDGVTVVSDLLAACPDLRVLATSRERLRLRGEHELTLDPLPVPAPEVSQQELVASPAVVLFGLRASAARAGFSLDDCVYAVAALCRKLDGLPLAIELAASRVRELTPAQLVGELDQALDILTEGDRDLPDRQRTLRSTIAWSYSLLDSREQQVLRVLAAFAGGGELEAIESVVASVSPPGSEVPDIRVVMEALVAKSLARPSVLMSERVSRWWLLETIRQFAVEAAANEGETVALDGAHTSWFVGLGRRAAPELTGPRQLIWLDTLEREHDNLRLALRRANPEVMCGLAANLVRFWSYRGHWTEGREWLERALSEAGDSPDRFDAMLGAGNLAMSQGDYGRAEEVLQAGLEATGEPAMQAHFCVQLGFVHRARGHIEAAQSSFEQAVERADTAGDGRVLGLALTGLGQVHNEVGDLDTAYDTFSQALELFVDRGEQTMQLTVVDALGMIAARRGDLAEGEKLLDQAAHLAAELGDRARVALVCTHRASVLVRRDNYPQARAELLTAMDIYTDLGAARSAALVTHDLARVAGLDGDQSEARHWYRDAEKQWLDLGDSTKADACRTAALELIDDAGPG